ncbi:MAG: N-acetyltransferase [Ferruginibacter sp.]|nr:N-acetyltransferase [Cytophagales bacterium]
MNVVVTHNPADQAFGAKVDGQEIDAELAYSLPAPRVMDFTHTYVSEELRGQGIAEEMIRYGLDYARENGYQVVATCPMVAHYLSRHPDYQSLLSGKSA